MVLALTAWLKLPVDKLLDPIYEVSFIPTTCRVQQSATTLSFLTKHKHY